MPGGFSSRQASQTIESSRAVILRNALGQSMLFGMHWSAVVGQQPEKLALKRARQLGATHCLMVGSPIAVVGCVNLETKNMPKRASVYSAAAVFARLHPESANACLVGFEDGACWLVAVHAGRVVSQTDCWYADISSAQGALEQVRARFPTIEVQVVTALPLSELPPWANQQCIEPLRLTAMGKETSRVKYGILLLILLTALAYAGHRTMRYPSTNAIVEVADARQRWMEVLRTYAKQHPIHSREALVQLVDSWKKVPLHPGGWQLLKVQCESAGAAWSCAARYRRLHRYALNQHLERHKPAGWFAQFVSLDQAVLTWSIEQIAEPPDFTKPTRSSFEWLDTLQQLSPLFEYVQLGMPQRMAWMPPADEQGVAMSLPSEVPEWQKRSLAIKGPLRSLESLQTIQMPLRWRTASLEIGESSGQTIAKSVLTAQLTGDLYESLER